MEMDWNEFCSRARRSAEGSADRFTRTLETATRVATGQSAAVYAGTMQASLVTIFTCLWTEYGKMTRALLPEREAKKIRWGKYKDRMREEYFRYLSREGSLAVADEYVCTHYHEGSSDLKDVYRWIESLKGDKDGIRQTGQQIQEMTKSFALTQVPGIWRDMINEYI